MEKVLDKTWQNKCVQPSDLRWDAITIELYQDSDDREKATICTGSYVRHNTAIIQSVSLEIRMLRVRFPSGAQKRFSIQVIP